MGSGIVGGIPPPPNAKYNALLSSSHTPSSLSEPMPPCPSFSKSHHTLPLCRLCRCLLHPLLWLVVVCWADGVRHCGRCHCLLDYHCHHHCLSALPSRGVYGGEVQGRKRAWWQLPWHQHSAIAVLWKGGQSKQEYTFMVVIVNDLSENSVFCKNGHSYKKNKNWRLSVHVYLKSTCTDDCQLMN
jgi:hypothetical protein